MQMKISYNFFEYMIILFYVFNRDVIINVEARVFCQDSNARPWMPLGHTCPVVCSSVRSAIDKLIMLDYRKSIKEQLGGRNKLDNRMIYENEESGLHHDPSLRRKLADSDKNDTDYTDFDGNIGKIKKDLHTPQNDGIDKEKQHDFDVKTKNSIHIEENKVEMVKFKTYNKTFYTNDLKILENVKKVNGILRRSGNVAKNDNTYDISNNIDRESEKCWFLDKFEPKLLVGKVVRRKCDRRSNFDAKFVVVMTNVLNKYVDTEFRFTDEMTEILLENIFGKDTDLRNNIFDVNKLLVYLRKSVDRHRIHSHKHVITLKSRRCLTVAMPGCFCRSGYVESSGQCVKPEDCVTDENHLQYLARIIIL